MNTSTGKTLATLVGGLPALLAPVSAAMADNTPIGGGMMGHGGSYWHMYGFNGAWLIALAIVVMGVVVVTALRTKR